MSEAKELLVDHRDLFGDDRVALPGARVKLLRAKAQGQRIVVTGPLTDTLWGTRAVTAALYDNSLLFDEVDQQCRYNK